MADRQPRREGYESSDISSKVVVLFGAGLIGAAVAIHLLIWLLYVYFGQAAAATYSRQYPLAWSGPPPLPPAPVLQVKPREELKQFRADEDAVLGSYAWIDAQAGVVRIPIERAMALVVQRGLPVRAAEVGEAEHAKANPGGPGTAGAAASASTTRQGAAKEPVRK
jgi:hypothetical protein